VTAGFDVFSQKITKRRAKGTSGHDTGMTLEALSAGADHKIAVFVGKMVDVTGIEPVTPCLQSRCSPS
jgi:hypothetical protein